MDSPISPSLFRLFFNRFVREKGKHFEIHIKNVDVFEQQCEQVGSEIAEQLKSPGLSPIARCRLLDDLGALCLIAAFDNNHTTEQVHKRATALQNKFLGNSFFGSGAWEKAEGLHPLVHSCATHWRGVYHGPPSPLDLKSEREIVSYLLQIASKTPAIVDRKRLEAVQKFLAKPVMVGDRETTEKLIQLFAQNWFRGREPKSRVIEPKEAYNLEKIIPDMPFARPL